MKAVRAGEEMEVSVEEDNAIKSYFRQSSFQPRMTSCVIWNKSKERLTCAQIST